MIEGSCHCGAVRWTFDGMPDSVTACNCTLCRRYGVLWIYDFEGERIKLIGSTTIYTSKDRANPALEIPLLQQVRLRRLLAWPTARNRWPPPDGGQRAADRAGIDRASSHRPFRRAHFVR